MQRKVRRTATYVEVYIRMKIRKNVFAKMVYRCQGILSTKVKTYKEIEPLKFESPPHSVAIAI